MDGPCLAAACTLAAAACTGSANGTGSSAGNVSPVKGLDAVTPTGTRPVSSVVWATTRDPRSLDAIYSYGYPENTADTLMCESLLRQAPDGSLEPGLATVANPNPTTVVFTLRPGVKFWDGHPVTSADVVYSLERSANPKLGGLYTWVFDRVVSIEATGPPQVTIKLKQPDYWLEGELSSMAGVIIERSFAEKEGANYGTPAGSIMCTGAYMLKSWTPGVGVVAVRNPHYWHPSVHPLVGQITIKGIPQIASLTSGLLTGAIQGYYVANGGLPTPGPADGQQHGQGVPESGLAIRGVLRVQPQGRARQPERAARAVAGAGPAGHHQLGLPWRGAAAAGGCRTRGRSATARRYSTRPTTARRC